MSNVQKIKTFYYKIGPGDILYKMVTNTILYIDKL